MEQNNNEIEKNDGNEELSTFNSQLSTKNNIYPIFDRMLAREDKERVRLPLHWNANCINADCYAVFLTVIISVVELIII